MSTLKTNNIEHLDASTPSIQTTIGGGTILAGVSTVSGTLSVGTGTSISSPATNTLALGTNDAERVRIDSGGRLLIGETSAVLDTSNALLQIGAAEGANMVLYRDDSSVTTDDSLGLIRFYSNAGSSKQEHARITATAGAASGDGDKPGNLLFYTTSDGASSPTERLRINSAGQIGIGSNFSAIENKPGITIDVGGNLGDPGLFLKATGYSGNQTKLWQDNNNAVSRLQATERPLILEAGNTSSHYIQFDVGGSEILKVNGDGTIIANGNLKFSTSGTGIDFSATSDGSGTATSEVLDDYEEGNWTPVPAAAGGGGTWTTTEAYTAEYTKVGDLVTVTMFFSQIYYTGTPLSYLEISGLPYVKRANSFSQGECVVTNVNFGADSYVVAEPTNTTLSANKCYFKIITNNSGGSDLQANAFSNTAATLRFTLTYMT